MGFTTLLITPPFTQLNTPYPATPYLKGFLNTIDKKSVQIDLGLDVILEIFSKKGLNTVFNISQKVDNLSPNASRIICLRDTYTRVIGPTIDFLQNKNPTLAHRICDRSYLPEASRFDQLEDIDWAFGSMGIHDKARHLATLFLEDISDLIIEAVDPHFGFSRYAERLSMSASSFDGLYTELSGKETFVDQITIECLERTINKEKPNLVCLSAPFPGNLYSALRSGQWIKKNHPNVSIALGGGYVNTELRNLEDIRVFEFIDFITLDDGEAPIKQLISHLDNPKEGADLLRTLTLKNGKVVLVTSKIKDIPQALVGTPDYAGLRLDDYLSVIEIANPMHRLWSDGRWNKLTLAHGCYWGKCTFCDISLDYIQRYEPSTAVHLCDKIEKIIDQTGQNGFHFVDEAAPPSLMKELALEILRRDLTVVWWTNIRFEKSFTEDLCRLLSASGCIAVSGGLEVASDRLLNLIDKGVTIEQVTHVTNHFTNAGILVHAYLMYGFPTETASETINSLEIVRQLFENGIVHSGFWHQFAMTAHSPVGLEPLQFNVKLEGPQFEGFAWNDLRHNDPKGTDHEQFSEGLRKSLYNYMHGVCLDFHLSEWFDFKVPNTTIADDYLSNILEKGINTHPKPTQQVIWIGLQGGVSFKNNELLITTNNDEILIPGKEKELKWFFENYRNWTPNSKKTLVSSLETAFNSVFSKSFIKFLETESGVTIRKSGLIIV